jgi:hypothetical protein
MPIHFKELEEKLERWLSFFMINKPTDSAASWVTYKVMQRIAKAKFLKELKEIFEDVLQEDVEIIEKKGKKHFFIKQSKL